ncbi:MAG: DUF3842 family protein [Dissulfurispiraceae bacterium]|nr:DUF3842 family protein [Dissulfurispiraceae bacterium]
MKIAVIDGQGGGIGSLITKKLREEFGDSIEIIALGTNSSAASAMMKVRANKGASGENAIIWNSARVDYITGPLSIILANSMLGEVTPKMAEAIASSPALKFLLPLNQERVEITGLQKEPLPHILDKLIEQIKEAQNV